METDNSIREEVKAHMGPWLDHIETIITTIVAVAGLIIHVRAELRATRAEADHDDDPTISDDPDG